MRILVHVANLAYDFTPYAAALKALGATFPPIQQDADADVEEGYVGYAAWPYVAIDVTHVADLFDLARTIGQPLRLGIGEQDGQPYAIIYDYYME